MIQAQIWKGSTFNIERKEGKNAGTVITLLFLPALYAIWFRIQPAGKDGQIAATVRTEPVSA